MQNSIGLICRNSALIFQRSVLSLPVFQPVGLSKHLHFVSRCGERRNCSSDLVSFEYHHCFSPSLEIHSSSFGSPGFLPFSGRSSCQLFVRSSSSSAKSSGNREHEICSTATPKSSVGIPKEVEPKEIVFNPQLPEADRFYSELEKKLPPVSTEAADGTPLTLWSRFKDMYKKYWYVLIPVHVILSAGWYGLFYVLALKGFDVIPWLEKFGLSDSIIEKLRKAGAGYLAAAFVMYKVATPIRYSATLAVTTVAINVFRKRGIIKPAPSAAQMRKMFAEHKVKIYSKRAARITQIKERFKKQTDAFRKRHEKPMKP